MTSPSRARALPAPAPCRWVSALVVSILLPAEDAALLAKTGDSYQRSAGISAFGEIGEPDGDFAALEESSLVRAERPERGYEIALSLVKGLPAPTGNGPRIVEDPAVGGAGGPSAEPAAPKLIDSFQGIGPTGAVPSDPILAVGPEHIVQCVNSAFRIVAKDGVTVGGATFSNWWGSLVPGLTPFDPWIVYDHFSDRWVMLAIVNNCAEGTAWYVISTSFSSDPTGEWCKWALRSDLDGGADTDDRADYPKLGVDDTNIYITSNQFGCDGGFSTSKVRVMNKSQLYSNECGELEWFDFVDIRNADDSLAFTVQPALTFGNPGREYLINAYSGASDRVTLWSISGTWPNPEAAPPVLAREATVRVGAYTVPPDATQCDGETPLHTGDARFLNAVFRDGHVFTCHTIESAGHAAARYLAIEVETLKVTLDEAICAPGYEYYYPAVMTDGDCNIVTVFSRSSEQFAECAGIRYTGRIPTDPGFRESVSLKQGEAPYLELDSRNRNRWGDYAGIATDPVDARKVWIFSEYARAPGSDWGTWVGGVKFPIKPAPSVALELNGVPDPAVVGRPFELRMDLANRGPAFDGILINLIYADGALFLVDVFPEMSFPTGLTLSDAPILSRPVYRAQPGSYYMLVLFETEANRIVAFDLHFNE